MPTTSELLPAFCLELQDLLRSGGRSDLAEQVPHLPIVARCTCGEPTCAHFYTAVPPVGPYGSGHTNIVIPVKAGMVVFDVVHDRVVAVEVLDRPDVKVLLDAFLPVTNARLSPTLPCPACGFLTVPEASYGTYNICDVCGWEDDAVQLANPACAGGANGESLIEAQRAALAEFPENVHEADGIGRSPSWRPLRPDEVAVANAEREEGYWKNSAIRTPHECYWARNRA